MAEDKKDTKKDAKKVAAPKAKAEDQPQKKVAEKAAPKAPEKAKAASASKKADAPKAKGDKPAKKQQVAGPKRAPIIAKTFFPKGDSKRNWRLFDANGQTLGRLSSRIAHVLMGKDKPQFTRFQDTGDFVIVINAEKVKLTGKKMTDKWYHYHTGYVGGIKSFRPMDLMEKHPERILERAVFGMIPKGHMGRQFLKKLRIYVGETHPHAAQNPVKEELRVNVGDR